MIPKNFGLTSAIIRSGDEPTAHETRQGEVTVSKTALPSMARRLVESIERSGDGPKSPPTSEQLSPKNGSKWGEDVADWFKA